jgi:hypothetical protein
LGSIGHYHKWQYDAVQLIHIFEECGFVDVDTKTRHQSRIADIAALESRYEFLMVEGVKP